MEIDPSRSVSRSDWRTACLWHRQFRKYPIACLLMTLLCVMAAAAIAFGWVDSLAEQPLSRIRTWGGVVLWLMLGAYFATCSALSLRA